MAAGRAIDLGGLQKELDGFKARVERWAQGTCTSSEAARDAHFQRLREFQAAIRGLEQQQEQLLRRAEEVKQRLACEAEEAGALQAELARVRAEQEALPPLVAELQEALEAETTDFMRKESALLDTEALKRHKLAALRQAAAMYQQRLGLAFEHSSDEGEQLHVVFTHVDPREAGRKFQFAVEVLGDSSYAVHDCQPALEQLEALVAALNGGGHDFSGFVRAVRREFQGVVQQEMAAAC